MVTATDQRRQAPAATRRAQILDAAQGCFSAHGYHATTMDDLVKAAGLSKGSLYWHFASKEDVFLALLERFTEEAFRTWDEELAAGASALDAIESGARGLLEQLEGEPTYLGTWIEFVHHPRGRERMAEVYRESRERLQRMLEHDAAAGRLGGGSTEGFAASLLAGLEGLLLQALVDPDFEARQHWGELWSCLRLGIERRL